MMEEINVEEPIEYLVSRRTKRSSAGNRLEAALAEIALEGINKEQDDDQDFKIERDEEDVFGSDFESTDEEDPTKEGNEAGETLVHEEERQQRKVARSRLEKATAAAHARNKASFNPQMKASSSTQPTKPNTKVTVKQVSIKGVIDSGSGGVNEAPTHNTMKKKRKSQRMHTVLNTSATVIRLQESEYKKASAPKKSKVEIKSYTQDELIARALDNEEGNIVEHRDYLKIEEEKRRQARVVRTTIEGPVLRWVSKTEEVNVVVPPVPPRPNNIATVFIPTASTYPNPSVNSSPTTVITSSSQAGQSSTLPNQVSQQLSSYSYYPERAHAAFPSWPPLSPPQLTANPNSHIGTFNASSLAANRDIQPQIPHVIVPRQESEPESWVEKVAKNYLIHELARYDGVRKPSWTESMETMFGNDVKWDEIKVYIGKGRPLARPIQICPITGKEAPYLDPRTGVAYGDASAYRILTELLDHHYIWSPSLGCYVGKAESGV